jgi:hypothetical protein
MLSCVFKRRFWLEAGALIMHALLPATETGGPPPPIVRLQDDTVRVQADAGSSWTFKIDVLSNDIPSGALRVFGVEQQGSARGTMSVDPSRMFLKYKLNTVNMWAGLSFTDTFRCVFALHEIEFKCHSNGSAGSSSSSSR